MKILFVNNLYPPHFIGGYEILLKDVVTEYIRLGHQARILTSNYKGKNVEENNTENGGRFGEEKVSRKMVPLINFSSGEKKRFIVKLFSAFWNLLIFEREYREFKPDLVFIWNMNYLQKWLLFHILRKEVPVHFHFGDAWICLYAEDFIRGKIIIEKAFFCSRYLLKTILNSGLNFKNKKVVYEGLPVEEIIIKKESYREFSPSAPFNILFASQLKEGKGIFLALEAMNEIAHEEKHKNIVLNCYGSTSNEILAEIKNKIIDYKLENNVRISNTVSRKELSGIMTENEIFLFPVIREEPWSLVLLQALMVGMPVVATARGANMEILKDRHNSIVIAPEKSALAEAIMLLVKDLNLRRNLGENAPNTSRDLSIKKMIGNYMVFMK